MALTVPRPMVSPMVAQAAAELTAAGRPPAPEDICWLYEMSRRCQRPTGVSSHEDIPVPIPAGNARLWRATLGVAIWIEQVGKAWLLDNPPRWWEPEDWRTVALGWILTHSRSPETLLAFGHPVEARAAVIQWAHKLTCTITALSDAIGLALGVADTDAATLPDDPTRTPEKPGKVEADYGDLLAFLQAAYGRPAREFLWETDDAGIAHYVHQACLKLATDEDRARIEAISVQQQRAIADFRAVVRWLKAGGDRKQAPT